MAAPADGDPVAAERVLRARRAFVQALGGYTLELPGASLVTHERVPVPMFNFVLAERIGPGRQSAFFERCLDHYFQRALRPTILTRIPVPPHLERGFEEFGFERAPDPVVLLEAAGRHGEPPGTGLPEVREVAAKDIAHLVHFWIGPVGTDELTRSFEVLLAHPNPEERLTPLAARRDGREIAFAALYEEAGLAGLHGVGTLPSERGMGAASALALAARARTEGRGDPPLTTWVRSERTAARLNALGYRSVGRRAEYLLPEGVALHIPPPGPPGPPRWRPPRAGPADPRGPRSPSDEDRRA